MTALFAALTLLSAPPRPEEPIQDFPWSPKLMRFHDGDKWEWQEESFPLGGTASSTLTRSAISLKLIRTEGDWSYFRATWEYANVDKYEHEWPEERMLEAARAGVPIPRATVEPILAVDIRQNSTSRDVLLVASTPLNNPGDSKTDTTGAGALILPGTWSEGTEFTGGDLNFVPSPKLKKAAYWRYTRDDIVHSNLGEINVKVYTSKVVGVTTESYINPRFGLAVCTVSRTGDRVDTITRLTTLEVGKSD